ncbi:hypothetical protein PALS2_174 [Staphylococcus phage PALS_2]|nr:hypothetical protein PALS2_174 [Staphylococcus phage PALS_2]
MKHFYKKRESIELDISAMYINHVNVISRYDFGNEELHQMVDRFIPQIVEEIHEFNYEINQITNNPEYNYSQKFEYINNASKELLDIILYLISINSTLLSKYMDNKFLQTSNIDYNKTLLLANDKSISDYDRLDDIKTKLNEYLVEYMGLSRRSLPNRKYHQDKEEISEEEQDKIVNNLFYITHKTIVFLLDVLFTNLVYTKNLDSVLNKIQDVVKNK